MKELSLPIVTLNYVYPSRIFELVVQPPRGSQHLTQVIRGDLSSVLTILTQILTQFQGGTP